MRDFLNDWWSVILGLVIGSVIGYMVGEGIAYWIIVSA